MLVLLYNTFSDFATKKEKIFAAAANAKNEELALTKCTTCGRMILTESKLILTN